MRSRTTHSTALVTIFCAVLASRAHADDYEDSAVARDAQGNKAGALWIDAPPTASLGPTFRNTGVEVELSFPFMYFGQEYESVWISAQG